MRFSVITPSFQSSDWLKLCIASVADQGVPVEHIVQDAGSTDGTLAWLQQDSRVRLFVERDAGMYDAINRGLARATGDVLAYLNCDEQYLPGALAAVAEYFRAQPAVDVVFGDFVVVNSRGEYLFHRKVQPPLRHHLRISHLPTYSCAMFFRRHLISEQQILFNPQLKAVGDGDWVLRLLDRGIRMGVLRRFTSVFALHESNLGNSPTAAREASEMHARAPVWVRVLKPWWLFHHRFRRWAGGMYSQPPFTFQLYTPDHPQRIERRVVRPTGRWVLPKPRDE